MANNLFSHVKDAVSIVDFVRGLPQTKGLHSVGHNRWRCNNVIAGGDNPNAMIIDDESGFFKAFSHGQESGDVITLYQLTLGSEGDSPKDSAMALAGHMGVTIPEELLSTTGSGTRDMTTVMNKLCHETHMYLVHSDNDDAVTARKYLKDRGMDDTLRDEWKLGLFPSNRKQCRKMLEKCGSVDILTNLGIIGGRSGDFVPMVGRLSFPIFSRRGDCLSFSSRVIPGVDCALSDNKYINTSNTDIYDKSATLYGQHLLTKNVEDIIVCEGNFDVIALNAMLGDNQVAVATCGTALTERHVTDMARLKCSRIIIAFDSDDAGRKSASHLMWVLNHITGMYVAEIPSGKDPWEMYQNHEPLWNMDTLEPPYITVPNMVYEDKGKDGLIEWLKEAYPSLTYTEDKENLLYESARIVGTKRSFLLRKISNSKRSVRGSSSYESTEEEDIISPQVELMISALLSFDGSTRRSIAFSLISPATKDTVLEVCGATKDTDVEAMLIAMGKRSDNHRLESRVFSLTPAEEEIPRKRQDASMIMAMAILSMWRAGDIPDGSHKHIPALMAISNDTTIARPEDRLYYVFDVATMT